MSRVFSFFPVINKSIIDNIGIKIESRKFFYTHPKLFYKEKELKIEMLDEDSIKLYDADAIWSPDEYNFGYQSKIEIHNPSAMYGKNGIIDTGSKLGIAVLWKSKESKQKGVIKVGTINNTKEPQIYNIKFLSEPGQFRNMVTFSTIVYLAEKGNVSEDEDYFADIPGTILGELDSFNLILDGSGSIFPIYFVSDKEKPLWYVECNWEEPEYDSFSETVGLYINKSHKNYRYLDRTKKSLYNAQLMSEIIASAIVIIIQTLKNDQEGWNSTINSDNLERGSVSQAIRYFIDTFGWKCESISDTSMKVRLHLEEELDKDEF